MALAVLCLMLVASVAVRLAPSYDPPGGEADAGPTEAVDLGGGVILRRGASAPQDVLLGPCWEPVPIEFVEPSPHGADTSLAGPVNAKDRIVFLYDGHIIDGRLAPTTLAILHLLRRAGGLIRPGGSRVRHALALKLTIPASCGASPADALSALTRDARTSL